MTLRHLAAAAAFGLVLAGCSPAGEDKSTGTDAASPAANRTEQANAAAADGPACPFRQTRDWIGSVEGGHVRVNGLVDLQMAGFRPALTERAGGSGTLALDLALAPAPGEPVSDRARYERQGAPAFRRAEIWCGGERIAQIDMIVVQ